MPQAVPQAVPQAIPAVPTAIPAVPTAMPVGEVQATAGIIGPPVVQSNPTVELERLAALHTSGMLSDTEFEQAKARVLGLGGSTAPPPVHMGQPIMVQPAFSLFGGGAMPMGQAV